jgi:hypothetical protein
VIPVQSLDPQKVTQIMTNAIARGTMPIILTINRYPSDWKKVLVVSDLVVNSAKAWIFRGKNRQTTLAISRAAAKNS